MELAVELRLALDKLKADIAKASATMKSGLESGAKGTTASTDKAGMSMDNLEKKVKKTTQAIKEQKKAMLDAWRANLPEPKVTISSATGTENFEQKEAERKARVEKIIGERPAPVVPVSSAKEASAEEKERRVQREADEARRADMLARDAERARKALLRAQGKPPVIGQGGGGGMGGLGAFANVASTSGIPALGQIMRAVTNPAVVATAVAMLALRKAIRETMAAFESARRMYARQLQSGGLPGAFVQRRAILADVIGVGENEVFQYGRAVAFLNERIRIATRTFTETNRTLTATGWNIKIFQTNVSAAWASFADAIAPAVNKIVNMTSAFVEFLIVTGRMHFMGTLARVAFEGITNAIGTMVIAISGLHLAFQALVDSLQWVAQKINNVLADLRVPGFRHNNEDKFKQTKEGAAAFAEMTNTLLGKGAHAQSPFSQASSRRLESSPWERMGLVIGNGPGTNYSKETARNTKEIVAVLKSVLQRPIPGGGMNTSPTFAQP
jgi:hypothetical protein